MSMDHSTAIREGLAVVTGASTGLGRHMALGLAREGVRVAALARSEDGLRDLAQESPDNLIMAFPTDVADPASVAAAFAEIRKTGAPTILINNAAVYPHRDFLDETPESFMDTVRINLGGMVACAHEALQDMVAQGHGRIVNVTTFAGNAPAPTASAYSVSKGATRILTAALQADICDRFPEIVINEWIPGALNTQMGIPDGLAPETAAIWGVRLALLHDREISGLTFARECSVPPPQGWKRKLLNRALRRRPRLVRLD